MNRPRKHYDNKPLVEALFELFIEPEQNSAWSVASLETLNQILPAYAFHEERLQDLSMQVQFVEGRIPPVSQIARERIRRWDAEREKAVQFGPHMCCLNVLAGAYTHYSDHKAAIEGVFRFFLEQAVPSRLSWIGQRYINNIQIPLEDRDVASYFEIYPRLPAGLAGGHRPLAVQLKTTDFPGGEVVVNLSLQSTSELSANYFLDVYARSNVPVPPVLESVMHWHDAAHEAVRESFEISVSQKCKTDILKERQ